MQTGKADCQVLVAVLALTALKRNPSIGALVVPQPLFTATTNAALRREPDTGAISWTTGSIGIVASDACDAW